MSRACAAHRCTVQVQRGMLMCRDHWFKLPKRMRDAIWATYRAGHWEDYRTNVDEARTYLAAMPGPFESPSDARRRELARETTARAADGTPIHFVQGRLF